MKSEGVSAPCPALGLLTLQAETPLTVCLNIDPSNSQTTWPLPISWFPPAVVSSHCLSVADIAAGILPSSTAENLSPYGISILFRIPTQLGSTNQDPFLKADVDITNTFHRPHQHCFCSFQMNPPFQ